MRAGAHVLMKAADPLNRSILRTVLERPVQAGPGSHYEVTGQGREALFVAFVIERWLQGAPDGPIDFESEEAGLAVAALAEGWASSLLHALARGPQTFRELRKSIDARSRRKLRRILTDMRRAGQVEARANGDDEAAAYAVTDWAREGIAPLIAAARLERRGPTAEMAPIDALDVEAAFLLALPLLELPEDLSGSCRIGVLLKDDAASPVLETAPDMAGVTARIDRGRAVACEPGLDLRAETWVAGTAGDWLDTVIEPDAKRVRSGGDRRLAALLLNGLHQTLFGVPTRD